MKNSQLLLSTLILGIIIAEPSSADWTNGGSGVINFPNTAGTDKIIFKGDTREDVGTIRAQYDDAKTSANGASVRNPQPTGYSPNVNYTTRAVDGLEIQRLSSTGPIIFSHVGKSNIPIACGVGQSNCGSAGQLTGTQTCTYTEVKLAGSVSTFFKILGIGAEYVKGYAQCATNASLISCPAPNKPAYKTLTYATIEERSQYGNHRMFPVRYVIFNGGSAADRRYCENDVGGVFFPRFFGIGNAECNIQLASRRPSWEQVTRTPIADTPTIGRCRTIKDLR